MDLSDVREVMRYRRGTADLAQLEAAFLERNGTISVITKPSR